MKKTTEFTRGREGSIAIEIGPVPGRVRPMLAVGRVGSPAYRTLASFSSEEAAREFIDALVELFEPEDRRGGLDERRGV